MIFGHSRKIGSAGVSASDNETSSKPVSLGVDQNSSIYVLRKLAINFASVCAASRHFPLWIAAQAIAERGRWALWLPVCFGAGVACYFALPFEPHAAFAVLFVFAAIAAIIFATAAHRVLAFAVLCASAALLLGFSTAKFRTAYVSAPVLSHRIGPLPVTGCVEQVQTKGQGQRVVLRLASVGRIKPPRLPLKARITFRQNSSLLIPDNCISATAILMPPPDPAEPGAYDFGRSAYFAQIGAVGYSFGNPTLLSRARTPPWRDYLASRLQTLRFRVTQRIHTLLPDSTGAIAAALITGDRGGIDPEDEASLRDSGLAHVLAIAGLHMALVGLGLFWVVRAALAAIPALALQYPIKKWAAAAALASATFYLFISGGASSARRAYVMLAMMLLAVLFDRPIFSMRSLAIAAVILLMLAPESLLEPGFQMSFAAVASLIAVAEWEQARNALRTDLYERPRFATARRYPAGIAITSFVGSLATAPYAIFHFDRATHYAVLGNLLAMPIMGFVVMPSAALSVILMPFGLDGGPFYLMGWGIGIMLAMGRWVSHLPGAVSVMAAWPVSALILFSLGGLWIALWRMPWRWLGFAPVGIAALVVLTTKPPDLLIARDGSTIALRGQDGNLRLIRAPQDKYSASEWLKRDGDSRLAGGAIAKVQDGVRCDEFGCIAQTPHGVVASVSKPEALIEDCARAWIVVSTIPARLCAGPELLIDRFAVARNGAYAVWLGDPGRVETVEQWRGVRPWSRQLSSTQPHRHSNSGG